MLKKLNQTTFIVTIAFLFSTQMFETQAAEENVMEESAVARHYADIAYTTFDDALITARKLQEQLATFVDKPGEKTFLAAKSAWKQARIPYQQSEVFRFGNPVVDNWEGQLNAWPLDEGLIDYVADSYEAEMGNIGATLNIVASKEISLGNHSIDASEITPELLASLNELGGSEANVATGYHAIEFLLWGQDLNGTNAGAGERPYTDYIPGKGCSNGNCDRRGNYLLAAAQLLVKDLEYMVNQWKPGGDYRTHLLSLDNSEVFTRALYGMGSLSLGELAGERMKVSLEAHSPEDEHDCFSDNTHNSHYYDALGVQNIYLGRYLASNGTLIEGPSLSDLVADKNPALDKKVRAALNKTDAELRKLVESAESGEAAFDQLIAEGNEKGHRLISDGIEALIAQTNLFEEVASSLGIDNLNPDTANHPL